jgi:hypothetical protein
MIRRTPGVRSTNHFWNLIQIGGAWYHFDATPNRFNFHGFMFTAPEAIRISAVSGASYNYFTYDPTLYPTIAGADPISSPDRELDDVVDDFIESAPGEVENIPIDDASDSNDSPSLDAPEQDIPGDIIDIPADIPPELIDETPTDPPPDNSDNTPVDTAPNDD